MSSSISPVFRVSVGIVAAGALLVLAACAPEPTPESTPTTTVTPEVTATPEPYAGPLNFVGDELAGFLLTPDEIASVLPGATDVGAPSAVIEQISDSAGALPIPELCSVLFLEQSLQTVGARTVEWQPSSGVDYDYGRLYVLQLADEAQAQTRMDQLNDAVEQCATFDLNGAEATFDSAVAETVDDVRALGGVLTLPEKEGGAVTFTAAATTGNVLVLVQQSVGSAQAPDPLAVASLLQERAGEARAALVDELTANPPTTEEEPPVVADAPWSDWLMSLGGVGPIRLGDPIDQAVAAGAAAQVVEPEYQNGPWRLVNEAGSSIIVQPVEDGDTVASITVGNARSGDSFAQDGSTLPSRDGIRVGDLVSDAVAAYPGGTSVTVVASIDDWYDVATRDGRLFRFHTDRDVVDPEAVIIGITVEDATLRLGPAF